MFDRLESVVEKFQKLEEDLGNPELLTNQKEYQQIARERAEIAPVVDKYTHYKKLKEQLQENQSLFESEADRTCGNSSARKSPASKIDWIRPKMS